MRKYAALAVICLMAFSLTACGGVQNNAASSLPQNEVSDSMVSNSTPESQENSTASSPDTSGESTPSTLIVYFSHTGTTRTVAEEIQAQTGADIFEIVPEGPYPDDYDTLLGIAREELESSARPVFTGTVEGMEEYDTIFLGYPIWHGTCPMIIHSFLEGNDFTGKTVIPFSTSGSSGISRSVSHIQASLEGATIVEGLGLSGSEASAPQDAVRAWLDELGFLWPTGDTANTNSKTGESDLYIHAGDHTFTATLEDNSSARALRGLLADGPLTLEMQDYANMEKVGELGATLPTNDEQITTEAGDLILYQGSRFVIYYAPNTWNFTRLGKIEGVTGEGLKEALGDGDVTVILSLEP